MRSLAREMLAKLTFEFLFLNRIDDVNLQEFCQQKGITTADIEYIKSSITEIEKNKVDIEEIIRTNLKDFSYAQIFKMDLAILMVAVYEIKYLKTPYQIVINEALNLAKKYSTDKSAPFINGVLSSIVK